MGYQSVSSAATGVTLLRPSIFRQVIDFANVFKAFIGTNWIALPFAFQQSGLALGCVGLLIISLLTDHCCQLIIVCKKAAVRKILHSNPDYMDPDIFATDKKQIEDQVERRMMYGDIGRIALGKSGLVLVEISLFITQFMFCVGYFIFIGNTIKQLFPTYLPAGQNSTQVNGTNFRNKAEDISTAPAFPLLVLIPVVPLILMAFIRRVRKLGPVSMVSNMALFFAFVAVLCYMLSGLKVNINEIKLASWATFPVFFGQVTSAYEGIGTLIPIESSMAENRHRYPMYLHLAIAILSLILGGFGILGYLAYGSKVAQIVTQMLPKGPLVMTVQILLCLAILFTYPLQLFPVTEIVESYLFKSYNKKKEEAFEAMNVARNVQSVQDSGVVTDDVETEVDETTELLSMPGDQGMVPLKKPTSWRKNIIRSILVLITAGIAILLKDDFAYVSALCGSVGSSMLAFILPCIFHINLKRDTNSALTVAKDVCLIIFGIVAGSVGLTVTVLQIVNQFAK